MKCARVTGDVMGKYHPHGDSSAIYDALVRMARTFSLRHPLIDFHGNFGSPDFGPAAARYTECRLDPLAMRCWPTSTRTPSTSSTTTPASSTEEPTVLPSRFPNLLVNGSQGIAVGMATNIPPHNLGEVIDATIHLIDNPDATPDDLMEFVKGPDFPTGALIMGRAGIMDAYRTGRGSIRMRAVAEIEETKRPATDRRHRAALPGHPNSVLAKIKELVDTGELEGIADANERRPVTDPARDHAQARRPPALVVLNNLYKRTPCRPASR
jgi:DNA gyrase subunit A